MFSVSDFFCLFILFFFFSCIILHTVCSFVTGVQTCALPLSFPIWSSSSAGPSRRVSRVRRSASTDAYRRHDASLSIGSDVGPWRTGLQLRRPEKKMNGADKINLILGELAGVASDPHGYAAAWKDRKSTRLNSSH